MIQASRDRVRHRIPHAHHGRPDLRGRVLPHGALLCCLRSCRRSRDAAAMVLALWLVSAVLLCVVSLLVCGFVFRRARWKITRTGPLKITRPLHSGRRFIGCACEYEHKNLLCSELSDPAPLQVYKAGFSVLAKNTAPFTGEMLQVVGTAAEARRLSTPGSSVSAVASLSLPRSFSTVLRPDHYHKTTAPQHLDGCS